MKTHTLITTVMLATTLSILPAHTWAQPKDSAQIDSVVSTAVENATQSAEQAISIANERVAGELASAGMVLAQVDPQININIDEGHELPMFAAEDMVFHDAFNPGSKNTRSLVIRSTDMDPKTVTAIEEDLSIMSRVLTKSAKENGLDLGQNSMTAMGMRIKMLTFGNQSSFHNMYLEGYGALFVLGVPFPLLPPAKPTEEKLTDEPKNSTWEEAKRELYGQKQDGFKVRMATKLPAVEYDVKRVDKLKLAIAEALKNAANIRNLNQNESVTVTVIGPANPVGAKTATLQSGNNKTISVKRSDLNGVSGENTTLTVRASKADIDAYAKGSINLDQFREKLQIAAY